MAQGKLINIRTARPTETVQVSKQVSAAWAMGCDGIRTDAAFELIYPTTDIGDRDVAGIDAVINQGNQLGLEYLWLSFGPYVSVTDPTWTAVFGTYGSSSRLVKKRIPFGVGDTTGIDLVVTFLNDILSYVRSSWNNRLYVSIAQEINVTSSDGAMTTDIVGASNAKAHLIANGHSGKIDTDALWDSMSGVNAGYPNVRGIHEILSYIMPLIEKPADTTFVCPALEGSFGTDWDNEVASLMTSGTWQPYVDDYDLHKYHGDHSRIGMITPEVYHEMGQREFREMLGELKTAVGSDKTIHVSEYGTRMSWLTGRETHAAGDRQWRESMRGQVIRELVSATESSVNGLIAFEEMENENATEDSTESFGLILSTGDWTYAAVDFAATNGVQIDATLPPPTDPTANWSGAPGELPPGTYKLDSTVALWTFDSGGSGTWADRMGIFTLTDTGGSQFWLGNGVDGGGAFSTNNDPTDTSMSVTTNAFNLPSAFSVACVFKMSPLTVGYQEAVAYYDSTHTNALFRIGYDGTTIVARYDETATVTIDPGRLGSWLHVVLSYDGTTLRLTVDGVSSSTSATAASATAYAGGSLFLMDGGDGCIDYDYLQIFNEGLSLSEVSELYLRKFPVYAEYTFNESAAPWNNLAGPQSISAGNKLEGPYSDLPAIGLTSGDGYQTVSRDMGAGFHPSTTMCWVRIDDEDFSFQPIDGLSISYSDASQTLYVHVDQGNADIGSALSRNGFFHVAVVYEGNGDLANNYKVYLNARLIGINAGGSGMGGKTLYVSSGSAIIADLYCLGRVLTQEEISSRARIEIDPDVAVLLYSDDNSTGQNEEGNPLYAKISVGGAFPSREEVLKTGFQSVGFRFNNADSYVVGTDSTSPIGNGSWATSVWYQKLTAVPVGKFFYSNDAFELYDNGSSFTLKYDLDGSWKQFDFGEGLIPGEWHHITISNPGSTSVPIVYIDSVAYRASTPASSGYSAGQNNAIYISKGSGMARYSALKVWSGVVPSSTNKDLYLDQNNLRKSAPRHSFRINGTGYADIDQSSNIIDEYGVLWFEYGSDAAPTKSYDSFDGTEVSPGPYPNEVTGGPGVYGHSASVGLHLNSYLAGSSMVFGANQPFAFSFLYERYGASTGTHYPLIGRVDVSNCAIKVAISTTSVSVTVGEGNVGGGSATVTDNYAIPPDTRILITVSYDGVNLELKVGSQAAVTAACRGICGSANTLSLFKDATLSSGLGMRLHDLRMYPCAIDETIRGDIEAYRYDTKLNGVFVTLGSRGNYVANSIKNAAVIAFGGLFIHQFATGSDYYASLSAGQAIPLGTSTTASFALKPCVFEVFYRRKASAAGNTLIFDMPGAFQVYDNLTSIVLNYDRAGSNLTATDSIAVSANTWTYIRVEYDGGATAPRLYVNSRPYVSGSGPATNGIGIGSDSLYLGKSSGTNANAIDVYRPRIWSRAVTPADWASQYASIMGVTSPL